MSTQPSNKPRYMLSSHTKPPPSLSPSAEEIYKTYKANMQEDKASLAHRLSSVQAQIKLATNEKLSIQK